MSRYYPRLLAGLAALSSGCVVGAAPFSQDFNGASLNPGWTFESPNADSSIGLTGSALNITAAWENGGSDLAKQSNFQAPRLLQPVDPSLDWTIETEVDFSPIDDYQGAGILLATTNGVITSQTQFNRVAERSSSGGSQSVSGVGASVSDSSTTTYLRVQKAGINYTAWWSVDDVNWTLSGTVTDTNQWSYFGLFVIRQPWDNAQIDSSADFLYFHLTVNPPLVNTFTWTGAASTDWSNTNNWYPKGMPGGSDTVIINSGTPVISLATNVGSVTLNGGTLNAGPGLVVSNTFNWTGGSLAGALTIPTDATLNLNNPGNTLDMPNGVLVNNGSVAWLAGTIRGGSATIISNNGVWSDQTDDQVNSAYGGQPLFYNNGSFTKSPTTGTTVFSSVTFNNAGTVNVQSGTLNLNGGGLLAGVFNVNTNSILIVSGGALLNGSYVTAPGGSLSLSGGSFAYGPSASFTGGGYSAFTGGSITLTNTVIPNLPLNGGTVSLSPTFQNGSITNLTLLGSTLSGNYALSGTLNWLAGGMSGSLVIANTGTLNLSGSALLTQSAAITNSGHIVWDGSSNWRLEGLNGGTSGSIWNLASGTFDILCSQPLQNYYGSEYMVNYGLVRKMQDPGTTTIAVTFTNSGAVSLLAGTLNFAYGDFGGSFSAANGTTFNFQNGGILGATFATGFGASVNLNGGAFTVTPSVSFTGAGLAQQTGGSLTFLNNVIPNLQLAGGTLALTPDFQGGSISNLTLNNQTLAGSNAVTGTLTLNNSSVSGPLFVAVGATVNWTGGTMSTVTIADGGTLNLLGPGQQSFAAMSTNAGAVSWTGGPVQLLYNNGFYNQASGSFNIQCDQTFGNYYGNEYFNNDGLVVKSDAIGSTSFDPTFNNFSTVSVDSGEIDFNGGGYLTGTYNVAAGGLLTLSGGAFTNTSTTLFEGAGSSIMTGGTITLISNLIPNLQIDGGTVAFSSVFQGGVITNLTLNADLSGTIYVKNVLNLTGNITGPLTLGSNSILNLSGDIDAPLTIMPTATVNWTGGTMNTSFILPTNAVLNLLGPGEQSFGAMTTNTGIVNWTGGDVQLLFNNGFYNQSGASFNIQCDQIFGNYYGNEYFNNNGLVAKTDTTGSTSFDPVFNNFGSVNIESGDLTLEDGDPNQILGGMFLVASDASLDFNSGGYLTGTYDAASGGLITLSSGAFTNTPTTLFEGAGSSIMTGGTITLISNLIPNLQIDGGTVAFSSVFQGGVITNLTLNANLSGSNYLKDVLNLTGNVTGPLTLGSNSILNLSGDIDAPLTIMPTATLNWTGGTINTAFILPTNAVLNLLGPGEQSFGAMSTNAGIVNWTGGSTRILYNNTFYNSAGATFNILCDQTFGNYYGNEVFNNAGLLQKFSTSGGTTFNPIIQNTGTIDVESGLISFNGTVDQNAGVWLLALNGADNNGQIAFTGSASLGGTLAVKVNDYLLGLSNQFTLVSYNNHSGVFAATNLPALGASWQLGYDANAITLLVTNLDTPSVALAAPGNNQIFILPGGVNFSASASDSFAHITAVQYYQGTNLLGHATASPYNFTWNSVTPGYYTVSALAIDANGAMASSAPVNISVFANAFHATNYTWTGAVSPDWSTPGNWTPNGVPAALDTVFIAGGIVNLSSPVSVSAVNLSGGALQGPGVLTVTNAFNWTGGNLTGVLTIGTNATFNIDPNGNISGLTLNNYGTILWSSGNLDGNAQTVITNYGLWLCQSDNQLNAGTPFVNKGTLRKTANTGTTTLTGMTFTNEGLVDAEQGTISFQSGGTLAGTYNAADGAAIGFDSGAFTLDQFPPFTGSGSFSFRGGSLTLVHSIPSTLNLSGGSVILGQSFQNDGEITNLTLAGSTLTGTNVISGTMDWAAGSLSGQLTVAHGGILNLTSGNSKNFNQSALINSGQVNWTQGTISGDSSSALTNNSLWLAMTDDSIQFANGAALFVNNGTFRKTAYGGTTYFLSLLVVNHGTFDAESGSIDFEAGGTLAGTYNAATGADINFAGGAFTLGALPAITGAGSVNFTGGSMAVLTNVPLNFQWLGGAMTLGPAFQKGGVITNLTLDGSTLSGNYTVTGVLDFLGGSVNGALTIATNAFLYLSSGGHNFSDCLFTNFGTVYWSGGTVAGDAGSVFVNNNLWLAQSDDLLNNGDVFINNGTYRKLGAGGESDVNSIPFDNNGLVDVQSGVLSLQGGGTLAGTYNTATFDALYLAGGNFTSATNAIFTGLGVSQFTGGNLTLVHDQISSLPLVGGSVSLSTNFQHNGSITNLTLSGSFLLGSNVVTGDLNWLEGGLNSSQLIIASNASLNILSAADKNLPASILVNNGTVIWDGGRLRGNSGTFITNNNLWLIQCDYALNADYGGIPFFVNNGVFEKAETFGTTSFNSVSMLNSGTISVQSGSINFAGAATYAQAGATLSFGVAAPNLTGQLNLPGNVNLDGNLQLQFLNGYTPSLQDQITLVTYGSEAGAFASLDLPTLLAGETWDLSYGASSVNLSVFPPPPTNGSFQITGSVTDNQGHPITGVRVYATPQPGSFTNLIQNGSFESPSIGATAYVFYGYGSTNITGWTAIGRTNSNVALTSFNWSGAPAEDGVQFLDPTGDTGGGGVAQTFPTIVGATYELIFYHGTYNLQGLNNVLGVIIGTNSYSYGETSGNSSDFDWRRVEIPFRAVSNFTTLAFNELTGFYANEPLVDNVQVISSDYYDSVLEAVTDATGRYSISVPPATYQVGVSGLEMLGFQSVPEQTVVITNTGGGANFVAPPLTGAQFFTITTAANPPAAGTAAGGGSFVAGANITVTASVTNALPYTFVNWTENEVPLSSSASYSFTVLRDQHLVANFILPTELITATVNPANGGSVIGTGSFAYGTTNTLTASANFGYVFNHWSDQNADVLGTSPSLKVATLSNSVYVANYTGTNLMHWVTTATLPANLATVTGAGLYANGQVAAVSAPHFVTNGLTYYVFSQYLLDGNAFTNAASFSWTFSTIDPSNLPLTAVYGPRSVLPLVIAAQGNIANPVKATTDFVLTIQFDRAMRPSTLPLVLLTNRAATLQPAVPPNGAWSTNVYPNDTYTTPPITFAHGMDGTNLVFVSQAIDLNGAAVALTNVLSVVVDATPPVISGVIVTSGSISAIVSWNTDEPATSEVNYGLTSVYSTSTGLDSQLLTFHSMTLSSLTPLTLFHYQIVSHDLAGNQTVQPDAIFSTIAAPDLRVTNLTITSGLSSGAAATISWVDTNSGSGPTFVAWYDHITVSNTTARQTLLDTTSYYDPSVNGNLDGGAAHHRSYAWNLPNGANGAGSLFITVTANIYSNQFELTTANNAESISAVSSLGLYPDLQVVNVFATPPSPMSGDTMTLHWTDTNTGSGAAVDSFYDQVVVTNLTTSTILYSSATYYDEASLGPIGPGQSARMETSIALPDGPAGVGTLAIGILADVNDNVYENNSHGTAKSNNTNSLTVVSTLAPYPDLVVTNIALPASVSAGQVLAASWVDLNRGNTAATNSWTEQVFLSSDETTNTSQLIASYTYTGGLAPGQSVTNFHSIPLPAFVSGEQWLVVHINPFHEVFELNRTNDITVSAHPVQVISSLALSINPATFAKNAANPAASGTITRYGGSSSPLTISLSSDNPGAATVPTTVIIAAGQDSAVFPINAVNDNTVDGTRLVDIVASSGGFENVTNTLTVTDPSVPTLTVSISAGAVGVSSNAAIACSVSRNTSATAPLTVTMVTDPTQLSAPATVTIPASASSVLFHIQALDLHIPRATYQAIVNATATGYASQAGFVTVIDDDAPILTLTFADTVISKGAANPATQGLLTASVATTQAVTVLLQTPSPAISIQSSVVIPANLTNVTFPVNVVQDNLVTGDRVAVVTAELSDATSALPLTSSATTATITVTDDNGPALTLSLANSLIPENGSTTATVTRNTLPTNALVISLASSLTTAATVPPSITIPVGSSSKYFTVTGFNPGVPTGPRRVDISASAPGYGSGVAALDVSDINLPDLVVTGITVPSAGLTTSNVTIRYVVANTGLAPTTNSWHDAVYYSTSPQGDNPQLLTEAYQTSALAVGHSYTNNVTVTLPSTPGMDYIVVTANVDQSAIEGNYLNDTTVSATAITNSPTYHAFIQADITDTVSPDPVPMQGYAYNSQAPNQRVPFAPVAIGVLVKGTERDYTVMTDANGNFTNTFYPIPGEAGHYGLTADYPNVGNSAVQSSFDIFGMRITDTQETVKLYPNTNVIGQSTVINLSDMPLTGVKAQAVGFPGPVAVQFGVTNDIDSDDQATLSYTLTVTNISSAITAQAYIEVSSDQGAIAYLPFNLTLAPQTALLVCNPTYVQSSMLIGQQTLVNFDVQNLGGAPSGPLSLELPSTSWISPASATNVPSLAPGQSNRFIVSLTPGLDLPLELYQGSMFAAAANTGVTIPFEFRAISEAIGGLQVAVQDEYTYFVAGAPLVTNAQVVLTDPITGSVVASNVTDLTGHVLFNNLDQGSYQMTVSAVQHSTYQAPVTIQPGTVTQATAFISRQTVSYSWVVVPTTIQDQYQVTLQAQFETEVPIPVVTIDNPLALPLMIQGLNSEVDFQVSNHGLIAAEEISLNLPTDDPNFIYTPLADYIDEIPAMSTITIPVLISWRTNTANPAFVTKTAARQRANDIRKNNISSCTPLPQISINWSYVCGNDRVWHLADADLVMTAVSSECNLLTKDCLTAGQNLLKIVNKESACDAFSCIQGCITDPCLNTILSTVCGLATGNAQGAISGALHSGNCFCPSIPPLPYPTGSGTPPEGPPPPTGTGGGGPGGGGGGVFDPIWDPISWDFAGCTPGETDSGSQQILSVHKNGGPTTTAGDVCAHVTIQINQKIAITRTAFQGTLVIDDSDPTNQLSNVLVALSITDDSGNSANNLFGIAPPMLTGVSAIDGTGVIAGGSSGTVQFTFVPARDAAPTAPVHYQVGGTLSYEQSSNTVTVTLAPQDIYVYPDPILNLDYFLQRDVIGDDPNAPGTITPQPFNLGLMVRNAGAGSALDFTITSAQPTIVENSKGLLINFQILGTEIGTNVETPSLTADLGELQPNTTTVAVWQLMCSLAGRFTSYAATFQHMNQLGVVQTSLIDNVNIHQMIHTFMSVRPGDDEIPDFLVNDIPNPANLPDTVYLSDGSTNSVTVIAGAATDAPISPTHMQAVLTATMSSGWNYLEAADPGPGYHLYRAVRSDGLDMKAPYNVWTTPLSFPATQTGALHTNVLHLVDFNGTGSYTLYYHSTNTIAPTIVSLQTVTPFIQNGAISSLQITFSEPIDLGTFNLSALSLTQNGGPNLVNNNVSITLVTNETYSIDGLASLTGNQGNYQLTVNATNVQDFGGNAVAGNPVISTSWAEGNPPLVIQSIQPVTPNPRNVPVNALTVTLDKAANASSFDYHAINLTLNGGANLSSSGLTVASLSPTLFQIGGLAALTGAPGSYLLTINAADVQDSGGNPGAGSASTAWTVITTGPTVVAMPPPQSPRNIVVLSQNVTFSEPINPSTFIYSNLTLTLSDGPNLITSNVLVTQLSPTNFQIQNFNWVVGYNGSYTLTVDTAQINDLAGNPGIGSASVTWVMNTAQPLPPTNLVISPITGIYPGITASNLDTLSGTIATNGLAVRIIDQTTLQDWGAATVVGTNFSAQLNLSQGSHTLQVYTVDAAANVSSNSFISVVVDQTPISATFDTITPNPRLSPVTNLNITFDKPIDTNSIHATNVTLLFNTTTLHPSLTLISSNVYQVGGLAVRTAAQGSYQLTLNLSGIRDVAGNAGSGLVSTTWQDVASLLPIISQLGNVSLLPAKTLKLSLSAYDPSSLPLLLQLGADAPDGVSLKNDLLTWTPSCVQGSSSNFLTIWALETAPPYLSNSMSFAVIVGDCAEIQVGSSIVLAGSNGAVPLNILSTGNLTNLSFTLDFPTNRFVNWAINPSNNAIGAVAVHGLNTTQTVFTLATHSGQSISGSFAGSLSFGATLGSSAFIPLSFAGLAATEVNNVPVATTFTTGGRVVVLGPQPLLEAQRTNFLRNLLLYGVPGNSYQLQSSSDLRSSANWTNMVRVPMANLLFVLSNITELPKDAFYRAYAFQASPPILDFLPASGGAGSVVFYEGQQPSLLAYGLKGTNYELQFSTNLAHQWNPFSNYMLVNSFQFFTNIQYSNPAIFYRIKKQ